MAVSRRLAWRCFLVVATLAAVALASTPACIGLEGVVFVCILPLAITTYLGRWYIQTISMYCVVITVSTLREVFVIFSDFVPCGLCRYTSVCTSHLENGNCDVWDVHQGECWSSTAKMHFSMVWFAVPPVLGALALAVQRLWHFSQSALQDWLVACTMVILMMPATYGFCSLYSLRLLTQNSSDLWTPRAIFDICELYVALSLFAFKHLVVLCASSAAEVRRLDEPHYKELWRLGSGLMQLGCDPYVIWCFFGNFMEIVLKEVVNWFRPTWCLEVMPALVHYFFPSLVNAEIRPAANFTAFKNHGGSYACHDAWGAFLPSFTAMNFLVCSIAVACIVMYEQAVGSLLHSIKPTLKFLGVKGLLLVSFWQGAILPLLYSYGCDEWCQARLNSFLLCWEAFALGVYHLYSYHPRDFKEVAMRASCQDFTVCDSEEPYEEPQDTRQGQASHAEGSEGQPQQLPPPVPACYFPQSLKVGDYETVDFAYTDMEPPPPQRSCCANGVM